LAARHDRGHGRRASRGRARRDRDEGAARGRDLAAPGAGEARRHALLLRRADVARDRGGARCDRVARLAAPYEGDPPAAVAARKRRRTLVTERIRIFTSPHRRGGQMPQEPGKIRNVAVVGHRGTGKTSLVEALLFQAGATNRLGTVEYGSTVSDWDDDEQRRQMSLSASICNLEWQGRKINLIDTPGDAGFQGDAIAALRVVEGALFTVSAVM